MMFRSVAFFALVLSSGCWAVQVHKHQNQHTADWWLFDKLGLTHKAEAASSTMAPKEAQPTRAPPSVAAMKEAVMNSEMFGKKTAALCTEAAEGPEREKCRQLAGERLFCALLHRNADKYASMEGNKEAMEKCSTVDIMENAVEATKDAEEQEQSQKD